MPVSESFPVRSSMLAVGVLTAALVLAVTLADEGEVVRLITMDETDQPRNTQLWIVEVDGQSYLRAGDDGSAWLGRLQTGVTASLKRDGKVVGIASSIETAADIRERVDSAMSEKYGFADRIWDVVRSSNRVIIHIWPSGAEGSGLQ